MGTLLVALFFTIGDLRDSPENTLEGFRQKAPFIASGGYAFADGKVGRIVHDYDLALSYRYFSRNRIGLGLQSIGKTFRGVSIETDRLLRLEHAWVMSDEFYLLKTIEWNLSHHHSQEQSLSGDLHYIPQRDMDLGLRIQWKNYAHEDAVSLTPTIAISFFVPLTMTFRSDILLKPRPVVSGEGKFEYQLHPRISIRAVGGGGKTDEGDGLTDSFSRVAFGATWSAFNAVDLFVESEIYRGDLRNENRLGGGIRCYF